jgi:DNA (cytosine-5)-methyltransferase 1
MLSHLDLFSGIGGFSLGLESAGLVETVAFCDFDDYCQKVLKKNFPGVPIYNDVKELNYDKLKTDGIDKIDIITGGYPCQPFSVAGHQKGEQDPRHVWPEMFRLIQELRPSWVIGENVAGHIKLGLDTVLENLESEGYSARTFSISASSIGANHKRERIWIVANSDEMQRQFLCGQESEQTQKKFERASERSGTQNNVANSEGSEGNVDDSNEGNSKTSQEELSREHSSARGVGSWWSVEPDVGRVAHGVPDRVDRLKCLGNSVVPQIPYVIGLSLKKIIENNE